MIGVTLTVKQTKRGKISRKCEKGGAMGLDKAGKLQMQMRLLRRFTTLISKMNG
jgi:hypothetical protein